MEWLEPDAWKQARAVLRGRGGGNTVLLPDYLKEYDAVPTLEAGLERSFHFYNFDRPHQSLHYYTPAEVHFAELVLEPASVEKD